MDEKNISATETQQTPSEKPAITVRSALEKRVIRHFDTGIENVKSNRKKHFELAAAEKHTGACCELAKILLQENDLAQAEFYVQRGMEAINISAYNTIDYEPQDYENRLANVFKRITEKKLI